jgi:short-subunit dehydrogenase
MTTASPLTPLPVAVIVGASSGIGEALAREFARRGYRVALLARRVEPLTVLANEINAQHGAERARGAGEREPLRGSQSAGEASRRARSYPHDVTDYAAVPQLFQKILAEFGRLDVLIYNAGLLVPVGLDEYNFEKDRQMIETNTLGGMAWLNLGAQYFERQRGGSLVGIGSVAGDRGRVGAPAYNTSKAALSTFLEALRNRLTRHGVHVLTVKPGFVATDMLKHSPRTFWVIAPEQAARDIANAVRARKQVIYTPARWGLLMFVIRHVPSVIFRRLKF